MDKKFCIVEKEYIKSDLNDRDNTMKLLTKYEKVKAMYNKNELYAEVFCSKVEFYLYFICINCDSLYISFISL